jgi:aspartyl-tRNA(Asn)/glutamyl-tRNA(Gln) amidotransferase subunit B
VAPKVSDERTAVRAADPELEGRFHRYQEELGVAELDADVLTGDRAVAEIFEAALERHGEPGDVAAWVVNEVVPLLPEGGEPPFDGSAVGTLLQRLDAGKVSRNGAREVMAVLAESGGDPDAIIAERGLEQVDDPDALLPLVEAVLSEFPDKVDAYRGGAKNLFGLFMGQVMRRSGGNADPALVKRLLTERLEG